jgi:hypothetical protein
MTGASTPALSTAAATARRNFTASSVCAAAGATRGDGDGKPSFLERLRDLTPTDRALVRSSPGRGRVATMMRSPRQPRAGLSPLQRPESTHLTEAGAAAIHARRQPRNRSMGRCELTGPPDK